ncbi:hypothetical protein IWQ60_010286 [Tieghemiomyces parasiticus]|uniref:WD repeat-containing protein 44 n=1 Tax=Tieghemiomyces parasiticus TaxID=78921 RepID=A0A9W7ZUX7_9FUNG|nr:hypothetical protein IWQ60_010286 [Tieghemiomyces parasiticus]
MRLPQLLASSTTRSASPGPWKPLPKAATFHANLAPAATMPASSIRETASPPPAGIADPPHTESSDAQDDAPPTHIRRGSAGATSNEDRKKSNLPFGPKKFLDRLIPSFNKPPDTVVGGNPAVRRPPLARTNTRDSITSIPPSPSQFPAGIDRGARTSVRKDGSIRYLRVRSRHKSTRLLNRLFVAQELHPLLSDPLLSPRSSRYAPSISGSVVEGLNAVANSDGGSAAPRTPRSRVGSNAYVAGRPGTISSFTTNGNFSASSLLRSPSASPRHSQSHPPGPTAPEAVFCLKFNQSGKYLASGGQGTVVRVWRVRCAASTAASPSMEDVKQLDDTMAGVLNTGDGDASAAPGTASETSDTAAGVAPDAFGIFEDAPYREYVGHTRDVLDLAWSKHDFLLSSSMDKTVRLWHISRPSCLCCFHHIDFVTSIAFHPRDDRFFLSGSLDGKVRLWNIPEKKVASWNELPDGHLITAVGFASKEGTLVAAGSHRGLCVFYETDGLKYHTQIQVRSTRGRNARGHKITGIQAIPSSSFGEDKLLITSNDSRIRLYNMKDKSLERKYKGHANNSSQIKATFSPDGKRIICGSEDHQVYVWDTQPSTVRRTVYQDNVYYTQAPMLLSSNSGSGAFKRRDRDQVGMEWFPACDSIVTAAIFAPPETSHWLSVQGDPLLAHHPCHPPSGPALLSSAHSTRSLRPSHLQGGSSTLSISQLGGSGTIAPPVASLVDGHPGGVTPDDASDRSATSRHPAGTAPSVTSTTNLPHTGVINQDIIVTAGYDGVIRVYRCDTRPESDIARVQSLYARRAHNASTVSAHQPTGTAAGNAVRLEQNHNPSTLSVMSGLSLGNNGNGKAEDSERDNPALRPHVRTSVDSTRSTAPSIFEFFGLGKKKPQPASKMPMRHRHQSATVISDVPAHRRRSTTLPGNRTAPLGNPPSSLSKESHRHDDEEEEDGEVDPSASSGSGSSDESDDGEASRPTVTAHPDGSQWPASRSTASLGVQAPGALSEAGEVPSTNTDIAQGRRRSVSSSVVQPPRSLPAKSPRTGGPRFTTALSSSLRKSLAAANLSGSSSSSSLAVAPTEPATSLLPKGATKPTPPPTAAAHNADISHSDLNDYVVSSTKEQKVAKAETIPPAPTTEKAATAPAAVSACPNCSSTNLQTFDVVSSSAAPPSDPSVVPTGKLVICMGCRTMIN